MATELERLVVTLEASTKQYQREVAKLNGITQSALKQMQATTRAAEAQQSAAFGRMGRQMGANLKAGFTSSLRGLGATLLAQVGFDQVQKAISRVAEIGDTAADLGIGTDALQDMRNAMILAGGAAEDMDKALADLVVQLADADSYANKLFKANNIKTTGKSTEELIKIFFDLVKGIEDADERLKVLGEVTGERTARKLAEVGRAGSAAFDEAAKAVPKITAATITETQAMEDRWNQHYAKLASGRDEWIAQTLSAIQKLAGQIADSLNSIEFRPDDSAFKALLRHWGLIPSGSTTTGGGGGWGGETPAPQTTPRTSTGSGTLEDFLLERGATAAGIVNANEEFLNRLRAAIEAAEKATGVQVRITSLARTRAEQEDIWRRSGGGTRFAAAPPGRSRHEVGEAADLAENAARAWLREHASEFGLEILRRRKSGALFDFPHIQLRRGAAETQPTVLPAEGEKKKAADKTESDAARKAREEYEKTEEIIRELTEAGIERKRSVDEFVKSQQAEREMQKAIAEGDTERIAQLQAEAEARERNVVAGSTQYQQILSEIQATDQLTRSLEQQAMARQHAEQLISAATSAAETFTRGLLDGKNAADSLREALHQLASQLLSMAFQMLRSSLLRGFGLTPAGGGIPGFQHGGSFRVGGSGGPDSQLVAFRGTPGEEVSINPRRFSPGAGGRGGITIGGMQVAITIEGSADENTVKLFRAELARSEMRQRQQLERDFGAIQSRYGALRGP